MNKMERKDFDFIGKQTPYQVPDGFFEEMQRKVMLKVSQQRRRRQVLKRSIIMLSSAAILAGIVFIPVRTIVKNEADKEPAAATQQTDKTASRADDSWINELGDEDLETMASIVENDEFLK